MKSTFPYNDLAEMKVSAINQHAQFVYLNAEHDAKAIPIYMLLVEIERLRAKMGHC